MTEEKFIRLNIAFRIPDDVAKAALELSKEIAEKEDVHFVLDGVEHLPHMTIYSPEYPEKNEDFLIETVKDMVKEFSPVEFEFIGNKAEQGYIGAFFEYSESIRKIHEKIVLALNPLREFHIREKDKNFAGDQKENIETYGYPNVMQFYEPHLTFTKLKDEAVAKMIAPSINWKIGRFTADSIGVFTMGEHGTCRKLMKEFKLGQ